MYEGCLFAQSSNLLLSEGIRPGGEQCLPCGLKAGSQETVDSILSLSRCIA